MYTWLREWGISNYLGLSHLFASRPWFFPYIVPLLHNFQPMVKVKYKPSHVYYISVLINFKMENLWNYNFVNDFFSLIFFFVNSFVIFFWRVMLFFHQPKNNLMACINKTNVNYSPLFTIQIENHIPYKIIKKPPSFLPSFLPCTHGFVALGFLSIILNHCKKHKSVSILFQKKNRETK